MRRLLFFLPLLLVTGCESGLLRGVRVTLPPGTEAQFSEATPGLVVSDMSGTARPYVVLCGQPLKQPLFLSQDLGFGCLGERDGTSETFRVWVEPLAAPAERLPCSVDRSFYEALATFTADAGGVEPASAPEATWVQGSATGTWKRDVSPCGGSLSTEVTLAVP